MKLPVVVRLEPAALAARRGCEELSRRYVIRGTGAAMEDRAEATRSACPDGARTRRRGQPAVSRRGERRRIMVKSGRGVARMMRHAKVLALAVAAVFGLLG